VGPDHQELSCSSTIVSVGGGDWISIDPSPFYPESGGQLGDQGLLCRAENEAPIRVLDCQNHLGMGAILRLEDGAGKLLHVGDKIKAVVDVERRKAASQHHTATHIIQRFFFFSLLFLFHDVVFLSAP
jgi:alanyl-tRNA synthetase